MTYLLILSLQKRALFQIQKNKFAQIANMKERINYKNNSKVPLLKITIYAFIFAFVFSIIFILLVNEIYSLTRTEGNVLVVIEEKSKVMDLASKFKENGLIGNKVVFKIYTFITGNNFYVENGTYILELEFQDEIGNCPICGKKVVRGTYNYGCLGYKDGCTFRIPLKLCNRPIPISAAKSLLDNGKTNTLNGFVSKNNKLFNASLKLEDNKVSFDFNTNSRQ